MDWIRADESLFDYTAQFTDAADTAVYGRVTYEMMQAYWPHAAEQPGASRHDISHSRWYNAALKVVVSRTLRDVDAPNTVVLSDDLPERFDELKQQPGKDLLLIGSPSLVSALMRDRLIDEFYINVNPFLLGGGLPLFGPGFEPTDLHLLNTKLFESGVVGLHYRKG